MSERRSWLATVVYIGLALTLALSFAPPPPTDNSASAAPAKLSEWDDVSTPSETDKVIVPESDILDFDMGPDGETIYAVASVPLDADHPGGCALFKSEDGAVTWDDITDELIEEGLDSFYRISVAPDDTDYVVVAGANMVVGSNDGGDDFSDTVFPAGSFIECLDVSPKKNGKYNIAVGTHGDIYRYESGGYYGASWKNVTTGVNAYAGWLASSWVPSIAFSLNFVSDNTILAITTDGSNTYQQSGLWGDIKAWNAAAGGAFPAAVEIVDAPPLGFVYDTGIALPDDFTGYDSGLRYNWVYVNYNVNNSADAPTSFKNALNAIGEPRIGEVFRVKGSSVDYVGIQSERYNTGRTYPLMASISMTGEIEDGNLMVGLMGKATGVNGEPTACCAGIQVYRTSEWPINLYYPQWSSAKKPPTGRSFALVAYTPDGSKAFASTAGNPGTPTPPDESAFSMSEVEEVGKFWNQLSLIDTNIDYLSDMAVNPACGTIWLFSVNGAGCGCDSVWSSTDEGASYMRVWCKDLAGAPEIGLIRVAPAEEEIVTLYLVDRGTKTIYWNDDSGITEWTTHTAAPLYDIMDLAVEAEDTVYAVDSAGEVSMSDKHGAPGSWSSAEDAKLSGGGHTIAALDGYVLVGGDDGSVGYSEDSADTFSRLGAKYELGVGGLIHVAFDTYFKTNDIVYAAVTGGDQRVWRWVINDSTSWKDLKTTSQDYYGIVLNGDNPMTNATTGGVLYALYVDGMARCLSPATSPSASKWDYLTNGVPAGTTFIAEPNALKVCGGSSLLWAIDTSGYDLEEGKDSLFVYEDQVSLNNPPQLSNPSVQPPSGTPSTNFYYYVRYYDSDGDSPAVKYVRIDGTACWMSLYSGLASNGVYRCGPKNLSAGSHSYYFYFEDGKGGAARLPISGSYSGPTVSEANNPPNTPSNPSPANHATGVSIGSDLSWTGGDPDAGDTVTYDVYFGTSASPPLVSNDQVGTTYDPGTLSYGTKYYWKIVATDSHAASTTGPLWNFTTASEAVEAAAERDLPSSVMVNEEFDVTITLGASFGQVVETLPANFTYISCAAGLNMPAGGLSATAVGQVVTFTFYATATPCTFTYKVRAPSSPVTGATFSGVFKSGPTSEEPVGGDSIVEFAELGPWSYDEDNSGYIEIGELLDAINDYIGGDITISQLLEVISLYINHTEKPHDTVTRDLPDSAAVNEEFDVTMTLGATFGQVVETLPADFTYVSCAAGSNMAAGGVSATAVGQVVTFTFYASATPATFTYTVKAPSSAVSGAEFSGVFIGGPGMEEPVGGDTVIASWMS